MRPEFLDFDDWHHGITVQSDKFGAMSSIQVSSDLPAYEQVKAFIKGQISAGIWRPGDVVPSESALQQQFGLSRMTVNRAVKELAVEGVVTRVQGSGTVVAQLHQISSTLAVRDIHEEVLERGHVHSTRVISLGRVRADKLLASVFQVPARSTLFRSVMVHLENDVPIQLEERFVNPVSAPHYLEQDFHKVTPTRYLMEHAPLTQASYTIAAAPASEEDAKQLQVTPGDACLSMTRTTTSGQAVASYVRLVYPGTRYRFHGFFAL